MCEGLKMERYTLLQGGHTVFLLLLGCSLAAATVTTPCVVCPVVGKTQMRLSLETEQANGTSLQLLSSTSITGSVSYLVSGCQESLAEVNIRLSSLACSATSQDSTSTEVRSRRSRRMLEEASASDAGCTSMPQCIQQLLEGHLGATFTFNMSSGQALASSVQLTLAEDAPYHSAEEAMSAMCQDSLPVTDAGEPAPAKPLRGLRDLFTMLAMQMESIERFRNGTSHQATVGAYTPASEAEPATSNSTRHRSLLADVGEAGEEAGEVPVTFGILATTHVTEAAAPAAAAGSSSGKGGAGNQQARTKASAGGDGGRYRVVTRSHIIVPNDDTYDELGGNIPDLAGGETSRAVYSADGAQLLYRATTTVSELPLQAGSAGAMRTRVSLQVGADPTQRAGTSPSSSSPATTDGDGDAQDSALSLDQLYPGGVASYLAALKAQLADRHAERRRLREQQGQEAGAAEVVAPASRRSLLLGDDILSSPDLRWGTNLFSDSRSSSASSQYWDYGSTSVGFALTLDAAAYVKRGRGVLGRFAAGADARFFGYSLAYGYDYRVMADAGRNWAITSESQIGWGTSARGSGVRSHSAGGTSGQSCSTVASASSHANVAGWQGKFVSFRLPISLVLVNFNVGVALAGGWSLSAAARPCSQSGVNMVAAGGSLTGTLYGSAEAGVDVWIAQAYVRFALTLAQPSATLAAAWAMDDVLAVRTAAARCTYAGLSVSGLGTSVHVDTSWLWIFGANTYTLFSSPSRTLFNSDSGWRCAASPAASEFLIKSRLRTNYCLDVESWSKSAGGRVIMWDCARTSNQRWRYDSQRRIVNVNSGLCLDSGTRGWQLTQQPCGSSGSQRWTFTAGGQVRSDSPSDVCVNVSGWGTTNGVAALAWTCSGKAGDRNEQFDREWL